MVHVWLERNSNVVVNDMILVEVVVDHDDVIADVVVVDVTGVWEKMNEVDDVECTDSSSEVYLYSGYVVKEKHWHWSSASVPKNHVEEVMV